METVGAIGIIFIVIQLIFLEGILSIDNLAVLGALVSVLPNDKTVPYPRQLKSLQSFTDRVLGMPQLAALKVGLLVAYLGRAIMLVMAAWVIRYPFLQVLGAAYLIKLAFGHLSMADQPGEEEIFRQRRRAASSFWLVVLNVELVDLVFSLDNVVAAVALSDELWVVMLGSENSQRLSSIINLTRSPPKRFWPTPTPALTVIACQILSYQGNQRTKR
jgi:tellurite resistance protein TerC